MSETKDERVTTSPHDAWVAPALERWRATQDREALGELLKWQRGRAYATALRMVRNPEDAEDVVQQACLKLLNLRQGFSDVPAFERAIYWSVTQCALNFKASIQARQRHETHVSHLAQTAMPELTLTAAERAEAVRAIDDELEQLSPDARAAVVLCCQEGLSLTDAAGALQTSRETLRDRLANALTKLRGRLKRRGVTLSVVLLFGLMRSTRAAGAPESLCAKLDAEFPHKPCNQIPEASAGKSHFAEVLGELSGPSQSLLIAALVIAMLSGVMGMLASSQSNLATNPPQHAAAPAVRGTETRNLEPERAKQTNLVSQTKEKEEEEPMNKKRAGAVAAVLAATVLSGAKAGDGDKKITKEDIKAAVRAALEREKNPPSAPNPAQLPRVKSIPQQEDRD